MPSIVQFYIDLWANNVAQYAQYADVYGWLAVASLIVAVIAIVLAVLRRADGIQAASLIGQHFAVYAIPFIVAVFIP